MGRILNFEPRKHFKKGDRVILPATEWAPMVERGTVLGMSGKYTVMVELDEQFADSCYDDRIRECDIRDVDYL